MPKKKIIGVTQRVDFISSYNERRDAVDQKLIDWIISASFFPLIIPNTLVDTHSENKAQPILEEFIRTYNIDVILFIINNNK